MAKLDRDGTQAQYDMSRKRLRTGTNDGVERIFDGDDQILGVGLSHQCLRRILLIR